MNDARLSKLKLPTPPRRFSERLWREWCFFRVALLHFLPRLTLIIVILCGGAALFMLCEPEARHTPLRAIFFTWSLVFGQPPEEFPRAPLLQAAYFVVPLLGLTIIVESIVEFSLILRDRRRNEHRWCKAMSAALTNHVVLIGLGKLGYRTFLLLRTLGETVVVIEKNPDNQFLEDVRRDGAPLFIGDARREALLADANIAAAKSIVVATNHDLANLEIALDARRLNPRVRVVLRVFDQNMADKICDGFNLQVAMSQSAMAAPAFAIAAVAPANVNSMIVADRLVVMQRWPVAAASPLRGKTVGDVMTAHGIAVVERQTRDAGPQLFPPPATVLHDGDELLVQGPYETLNKLLNGARAG